MADAQGPANIDDRARIKALSHPTRMRILALLRVNGAQTAATLGAAVDEAPGTVSYHCARLAAVGLIEPAVSQSDDRRERWWQAAQPGSEWHLGDALEDPEQYLALAALDRTAANFFATTHDRYVERAPGFGREWVEAAGVRDQVLRLTPAELRSLMQELAEVVGRWEEIGNRHQDGDGAEKAYVLMQGYRWPW